MIIEKIVEDCKQCPFHKLEILEKLSLWFCHHPNTMLYLSKDKNGSPITPDNCPLKKQSIIISFKTNKDNVITEK